MLARPIAFAVAALGIAAGLTLPGCIVAIGNDGGYDPSGPQSGARKIALTTAEREELPVITTTADLPTVRSRYANELGALSPDTSIEDFRARIPASKFVERKDSAEGPIDAYSVRIDEKYRYRSRDYGYIARDEQWFYFRNARLVKWGQPHQWP